MSDKYEGTVEILTSELMNAAYHVFTAPPEESLGAI